MKLSNEQLEFLVLLHNGRIIGGDWKSVHEVRKLDPWGIAIGTCFCPMAAIGKYDFEDEWREPETVDFANWWDQLWDMGYADDHKQFGDPAEYDEEYQFQKRIRVLYKLVPSLLGKLANEGYLPFDGEELTRQVETARESLRKLVPIGTLDSVA